MEDNKDNQIQMKKIPAFTVLKNGSILKNIFLLRKQSATDQSSQNQEPGEEILFVGRHPHCHIILEHPSISRYHLRIHSNPSSHTLSVYDLSSVHGTWVSGTRIEPGVHVMLKEGDTMKIGGSSRVYELHWVPLSQAYNVDERFISSVYTIKEDEDDETHRLVDEKNEEYSECLDLSLSNKIHDSPLKILNPLISSVPCYSSSDTEEEHLHPLRTGIENDDDASIQASLVVSETTSAATDVSDSLSNSEDQLNWLRDNISNELELLSQKNIREDLFSVQNCSESLCVDTEVENLSPWKTSNGNGEPQISILAPLVVSEAISEPEISACLNKPEDQFNGLMDNLSIESDQFSHGGMKDNLVSVDLFNAIIAHHEGDASNQDNESSNETVIDNENVPEIQQKTNNGSVPEDQMRENLSDDFDQISHETMKDEPDSIDISNAMNTNEQDALNEDTARSNEIDIDDASVPVALFEGVNRDMGCEFEQMNHIKLMDESDSMILSDVVDMGVKFASLDHKITDKESVFELLPDVTDTDEEKTSTPYIPKAKEIDMNLQSVQNASSSMKLFDSLDGKELEFYTPDKENKNPNACSVKSLSKQAVNSSIYEGKEILSFSQKLSATDDRMTREHEVDLFLSWEEVLAASLEKENKTKQLITEGSCHSINCPESVQKAINSTQHLAKKRWTMLVDSNTLLDNKSLKHLKLLEGIKGTRLIVPKTVLRELMDIKSQDCFFKGSLKKVSLALKWIDECMMNTRWWIHIDDETFHSSTAVPEELMDIKSQDSFFKRSSKKVSSTLKWIDECLMNTTRFHSSTAAPEVLEIALHLRKEITDQKIVILSNNLTLKIKAMAEGIMCEAAEEFRESLVNPFSERFMWVGSSARGLTWSCVDDDAIVWQKYHGFGLNKSHRIKGLKLLAHVTTCQLVAT
ncbi:hypothetical protein QVD17_10494 [Tagetes erecta]|uniref:FHA domain-containing protein n=1 Tax=Tagetes erecta TaxID=13708 RepID=A0AAD8L2J5_TARER|nr:hypothetical protein QVD17_10494 [Tagetes erecta]